MRAAALAPAFALALVALAGCAAFPDLERRETAAARDAAAPPIIPLGSVFAREAEIGAAPNTDDAGRAARLRARVAALRGTGG